MAQLINAWITKEKLEILLKACNKKQVNGIGLTISVNNQAHNYGKNVSAWVSQTKEEKDSGKEKYYVMNGNTVWSDSGEPVFKHNQSLETVYTPVVEVIQPDDDLPF